MPQRDTRKAWKLFQDSTEYHPSIYGSDGHIQDDPTVAGGGWHVAIARDTAQIHVKAVDAPDSLMYTVVFAMSNNYWNIFS
ncbi:MAG: hypothetical protein Ct9H300mP19_10620 [Dehalococcoidia bacterium]|nr:MAG: hypothetical protein Ct9H300mP19_10620 [Dehalococcoidia bacterium]